ncbi:MAG: ABC transporter permease [Pseudomonadota bacterium]
MTDLPAPTPATADRDRKLRSWTRWLRRNPFSIAAAVLLSAIVAVALFAPWITMQNPHDPADLNLLNSLLPPGSVGIDGQTFWLGTDDQGRDIASAIAYGLRISLTVAVTSSVVAIVIGTMIGLLSAFVGGRLDALLMRIVDIQLSFPAVLIALVLVALLGRGVDKTIIALIVVQWAYYARTVRSVALSEKRREYIEAAYVLGFDRWTILTRHLLPNCLAPVTVVAAAQIGGAISLEATLSFLGLGVPVTQPSLGLLIANGFQFMFSGRYWVSFGPGIALLLLVVAINILAERLREYMNPRSRR